MWGPRLLIGTLAGVGQAVLPAGGDGASWSCHQTIACLAGASCNTPFLFDLFKQEVGVLVPAIDTSEGCSRLKGELDGWVRMRRYPCKHRRRAPTHGLVVLHGDVHLAPVTITIHRSTSFSNLPSLPAWGWRMHFPGHYYSGRSLLNSVHFP